MATLLKVESRKQYARWKKWIPIQVKIGLQELPSEIQGCPDQTPNTHLGPFLVHLHLRTLRPANPKPSRLGNSWDPRSSVNQKLLCLLRRQVPSSRGKFMRADSHILDKILHVRIQKTGSKSRVHWIPSLETVEDHAGFILDLKWWKATLEKKFLLRVSTGGT